MKQKQGMLLLALIASGCLVSCSVDNDFDLDNVDMTIGTTTDLTLPTLSTSSITMKSLIDLKADGIVKELADGTYAVRQEGTADIKPVNIDPITIARPTIGSFDKEINLSSMTAQSKRMLTIHVEHPLIPGGSADLTLPDQDDFLYVVEPGMATYSITEKTTTVSKDVISIESVAIEENKISLSVNVKNLPTYITKVHMDNVALTLPEEISVKSCTYQGKPATSIEKGKITLITGTDTEGFNPQQELKIEMVMEGVSMGENFKYNASDRLLSIKGTFGITGTIRLNANEFEETKLNAAIANISDADKQKIYETKSLKETSLIPEKVQFAGSAAFAKDIKLTTFSGQVKHEVEQIEGIKLDNLPDFLNDDEVVLDLANPAVFVTASSNLPGSITTALTLKSTTSDKDCQTGNITVVSDSKDHYYCIAEKPAEAVRPTGEYAGAANITVTNMGSLIHKIPKAIDIEVSPVTLNATNLKLGQPYDVNVKYEVYAPLTFGPTAYVKYTSTESDMAKDLEDVKEINAKALKLTSNVDSDIPFDLRFSLIIIDKNKNEVKKNGKAVVTIAPVKVPGLQKNCPITFEIKPVGCTLSDIFSGKNGVPQMDGIQYTARILNPTGDKTLTSKGSIQLKDIKLSIVGGVTYDAN